MNHLLKVTEMDATTIDDAEDLDLVMPIYRSLENSSKNSYTTGSLWFYSKDEAFNFNSYIEDNKNFKYFKYQAKLLQNADTNGANKILRNGAMAVPLKYLSIF